MFANSKMYLFDTLFALLPEDPAANTNRPGAARIRLTSAPGVNFGSTEVDNGYEMVYLYPKKELSLLC